MTAVGGARLWRPPNPACSERNPERFGRFPVPPMDGRLRGLPEQGPDHLACICAGCTQPPAPILHRVLARGDLHFATVEAVAGRARDGKGDARGVGWGAGARRNMFMSAGLGMPAAYCRRAIVVASRRVGSVLGGREEPRELRRRGAGGRRAWPTTVRRARIHTLSLLRHFERGLCSRSVRGLRKRFPCGLLL
jgi:hypothetical protein